MIDGSLSKNERRDLLRRYAELLGQHPQLLAVDEHRSEALLAQALEGEYFDGLPRLVMSCCPYCRKPLVRSFDPFGLDGFWWRHDANPPELPACPHFCVLVGAVSFHGYAPRAGSFEVTPGPEVPYVIPRVLDYPGMILVISQLGMENGCVAYPLAYFADRRPPPQELTAGWARALHSYVTQLGERGARAPDDPWDFELHPWLAAGKIRWCPPGSDNTALSTEAADRCPYVDLPGERQRMIVQGDRAAKMGLPGHSVLESSAMARRSNQ